MARVIPAWIDPETAPPGEVILFEALKVEPGTDSWTVLHSVDLPRHVRQAQGEADFVILIPALGALCLEVKSHQSVSRGSDGLWRLGADPPTPRSPFRQASDAMHSLANRLREANRSLMSVPFVSAVCFPRCNFDVPAVEWEEWQVVDERALRARSLETCLRGVLIHARRRYRESPSCRWFHDERAEPSLAQCETMIRLLRPVFEVHRSPKARRYEREAELKHYTEEQYLALDGLERNPRVLITGPAGTGKTLLALEAARRSRLAGERTLLLCYNTLLGHWLRNEAEPLAPEVTSGTLHSLLVAVSGLSVPDPVPPTFWLSDLPEAAADALLAGHEYCGVFDRAILDETQDLASDAYLDVIDLLLAGGLEQGRVLAFGDFARQAIYGCSKDPETLIHKRIPHLFSFGLTVNCRTRPRIGALISRLSGLEEAYRRFRRRDDGVEPDPYFYDSDATQLKVLEAQLDRLRSEGHSIGDITILSTRADGAASQLGDPWRSRLQPARERSPFKTRYTTAHAFKGLESPAIVITDVEDIIGPADEAVLYVAMTRATDRLILIGSERAKQRLWDMFWRPPGGAV